MKYYNILIIILFVFEYTNAFNNNIYSFKMNNDNIKKLKDTNKNYIDRNIYARYLIDKRKSEKIFREQTTTLTRYINKKVNNSNQIEKLENISNFDNEEIKIRKIIIDNVVYIDVNNVKNIKISTRKNNIKIELDRVELDNKKILNELDMVTKNIKELDTILNLLDIFLTILK